MASVLLPLSLLALLWPVHAFKGHSFNKASSSPRWLAPSPLLINKDSLPRRVASSSTPQMAETPAAHDLVANKMKEHRLLQSSSYGGMFKVALDHPLGNALHDLPKVLSTQGLHAWNCTLTSKASQQCLGSALSPNVTALLDMALPSHWDNEDSNSDEGKDMETRECVQKGKEISAEALSVKVSEDESFHSVKHQILQRLFPTAMGLELRLRKLTIHETGAFSDFQSDTKSQENHLATLLVEVKSAHRGGRLALKADGKEFPAIDFSASSSGNKNIAWIAFYNTDVHHKVEPVTEGTRMVLQFDVLVKHRERSQSPKDYFDRSLQNEPYLSRNAIIDDVTPMDKSKLNRVLSLLNETLAKEQRTLALPLFHFYRTEAIRPEFLKSVDRELFSALLKTGLYDVALSPISLQADAYYNEDNVPISFRRKPFAMLTDPVDKMFTGFSEDGQVMEVPVGADHPFNKDISQYITSRREPSENIDLREYTIFMIYEYFLGSMLVRKKEEPQTKHS